MSTPRITDGILAGLVRTLQRKMTERIPVVDLDLHVGNTEYKITNKLVVTLSRPTGGGTIMRQVWADGMAGYSKRDAYNALRLMNSTLDLLADFRE